MEEEKKPLAPIDEEKPWLKLSDKSKEAIERYGKLHRTKHGLFANIPMVCKANECPYNGTCPAILEDMAPEGERCPIEISMIQKLFEDYTTELQIDASQIVNLSLVKNLIEAEITIARCDALLAMDPNIIQKVAVSITPQGKVVEKPEAHTALGIREKAIAAKNTALQLLNSTPKDKAKRDATVIIDPSTYATSIMNKFKSLQKQQAEVTIDAEARVYPDNDESGEMQN
jgi:hypothetical protein